MANQMFQMSSPFEVCSTTVQFWRPLRVTVTLLNNHAPCSSRLVILRMADDASLNLSRISMPPLQVGQDFLCKSPSYFETPARRVPLSTDTSSGQSRLRNKVIASFSFPAPRESGRQKAEKWNLWPKLRMAGLFSRKPGQSKKK